MFDFIIEKMNANVRKIFQMKKLLHKLFYSIGLFLSLPKILYKMIRIKTYEGILLSKDDSKQLIELSLQRELKNFSDFKRDEGMMFSDYWGDVYLLGPEEDYRKWITKIAERILKK